ncbi:hypothetical protein GCM10020295_72040 [Streptomyces cinereospinus]
MGCPLDKRQEGQKYAPRTSQDKTAIGRLEGPIGRYGTPVARPVRRTRTARGRACGALGGASAESAGPRVRTYPRGVARDPPVRAPDRHVRMVVAILARTSGSARQPAH